MNGFEGRKTGLFKPVWLADRFLYGLEEEETGKDMLWSLKKLATFKIKSKKR